MDSLRLDKWLWFARFVKTRSLAQTLIDDGDMHVNGKKICKHSYIVHVGDHLHFALRGHHYEVTVLGLADRRGGAPIAETLYQLERITPIAP